MSRYGYLEVSQRVHGLQREHDCIWQSVKGVDITGILRYLNFIKKYLKLSHKNDILSRSGVRLIAPLTNPPLNPPVKWNTMSSVLTMTRFPRTLFNRLFPGNVCINQLNSSLFVFT